MHAHSSTVCHTHLPPVTLQDEGVDSIYVAVMATHRPHYLYRTLRSLAFAPGVVPDNVLVYLENSLNPELEALVSLFGFKVRSRAAERVSCFQLARRLDQAVDTLLCIRLIDHSEYYIGILSSCADCRSVA